MADSENTPEKPEQKTPAETETIEAIPHYVTGSLVIRKRGPNGTFLRGKGTAATSKQRREVLRNFLDRPEVGPDGKMKPRDRSRHQKIIENMARIAMDSGEQPVFDKLGNVLMKADGTPLTIVDAKIRMAAIQAYKELMLRADGKYSTSDEDLEAQKLHGVKIVVITPPPEMMNREVIEEKPREKLQPSFIEGEFTDDKSKR